MSDMTAHRTTADPCYCNACISGPHIPAARFDWAAYAVMQAALTTARAARRKARKETDR